MQDVHIPGSEKICYVTRSRTCKLKASSPIAVPAFYVILRPFYSALQNSISAIVLHGSVQMMLMIDIYYHVYLFLRSENEDIITKRAILPMRSEQRRNDEMYGERSSSLFYMRDGQRYQM